MKKSSFYAREVQQLRFDLEEVILSACLCDRNAFSRVMDILTPQNFIHYTLAETETGDRILHPAVWAAMQECCKTYPIDILTVRRTMLPQYSNCRGLALAISKLTERSATGCNIKFHAVMLVEFSIREAAITLIQQWMDDSDGQRLDDFIALSSRFKDLNSDALIDVEKGIGFLKECGYKDESAELHELLGMIARRMIQIKKQHLKEYMTEQSNKLNTEDDGE